MADDTTKTGDKVVDINRPKAASLESPEYTKKKLLKQKEDDQRKKDNDMVLRSLQLGKYKYQKTV